MDRIFVEGLSLKGKHGVHHKERQEEQEFLIDISAQMDTRAASASDEIADTADYSKFCEVARNVVKNNSFYLIERLAERIAQGILADSRITSVEVTVRKPEALPSGIAGVTITRARV